MGAIPHLAQSLQVGHDMESVLNWYLEIWKPVNASPPPQCLVDVTAGNKVQVIQGQCRRKTVLALCESLVCDGCSMTDSHLDTPSAAT